MRRSCDSRVASRIDLAEAESLREDKVAVWRSRAVMMLLSCVSRPAMSGLSEREASGAVAGWMAFSSVKAAV